MIVSKEQRDIIENGEKRTVLIVSYVNPEGGISFLTYKIPKEEMFLWKLTNKAHGDPVWKSYDGKPVRKVPTKTLDEHRINEIICSFREKNQVLFEFNRPVMWFCDIETDILPDGFPDPNQALAEINTIAITRWPQTIVFGKKPLTPEQIDSIQKKIDEYNPGLIKGYKFEYRQYDNEVSMLYGFLNFIEKIPAITGWNFPFDWKTIINRCKKNNIPYRQLSPSHQFVNFELNNNGGRVNWQLPLHKIVFDYLVVYRLWDRSIFPKENNTLDFVSERALGIKKVQHNLGFKEFYEQDYENYVFYNAIDTILVEQIDKKLKLADVWLNLANELKIDLNMAFSTVKPTQVVMGNFIYDEHKVMPHKEYKETLQESYEGAFVWPSQPGVFRMVTALDYSSLYPSTIRMFLISPEAFLFKDHTGTYKPKEDEIKCSSGAVFKKDKDNLIPRILTHYFNKRKATKVLMKECNVELDYLKHIYEKRTGEELLLE